MHQESSLNDFKMHSKTKNIHLNVSSTSKWFLLHLCPLYPVGIFFVSSNYYLSNSISSVLFYLNDKLCVFKLSCGRYFCEDQVACVHLFKFPDSRVESSKLFKYPPNETRFLSDKNVRVNVLLLCYLLAVGYLLRLLLSCTMAKPHCQGNNVYHGFNNDVQLQ